MSRPCRTAAFAVVLSSLITGVADAKPTLPPTSPTTLALAHASERRPEALAPSTVPATTRVFVVAPALRAKLLAAETASTMPSANADLVMWSDVKTATPSRALHPTVAAAVRSKVDTIHRFARGIVSRTSSIAMSLTRSAMRFIGTPYVFGGTSPSGFDCSGYTQHVFAMLGIPLPRTADAQFYAGHKTVGGMATGDLVFFQTYEPGPSHVGIYVGAGKFIHSSSHGVMVSRLDNSYWRARYIGAKRIVAFR